MAQTATSYDNNQVIVDKIKALRFYASARRNLTLQKKIKAESGVTLWRMSS